MSPGSPTGTRAGTGPGTTGPRGAGPAGLGPGGAGAGGGGGEAALHPPADPAGIVADLRAAGAGLRTDGPPPGPAWVRAWTAAVDQAIEALATPAVAGLPIVVAAVGGYGRNELAPASDVDLLLVHGGLDHTTLEQVVRRVVYPLWDAGLEVGYAVRDRREAISATDEIATATATMSLRPVAGHAPSGLAVRAEVLRRLRRRPHRFLAALARADQARRARAGDAAELLEPDLHSGAGGLRDLQSLRWAAAAVAGVPGLAPLVPAGYLAAPDLQRLAQAEELLLSSRVALHLVAERGEVLRMELHGAVAAQLGIDGGGGAGRRGGGDAVGVGGVEGAQQLMHRLALAARTVEHAHGRAWALLSSDVLRGRRRRERPAERSVEGFELVDGVLRLPATTDDATGRPAPWGPGTVGGGPDRAGDGGGCDPVDAPDLPVRLLAALAGTGAVLDRRSAALLRARAEVGDAGWGWAPAVLGRFLEICWRGSMVLPAVAELDETGVLAAWLPEWAPLRGRPQRSPVHRYTLDRHAWHAVAELGELVRREAWAAETLEEVDDRDGLLLGVLLHDVGKTVGEPHGETGVPLARAVAERMGAASGSIALIERLVRLHLLLPDTARRRDIADPALIAEVARTVGDRRTLACLHLVAVADGRATGPAVWSEWTAALVADLVRRVRAVLDAQRPDEAVDGAIATARAAQELAAELGATPAAVRAHLAMLPPRYAAAVSPRAVVRHTLMAASRPVGTEVRTRVIRAGEEPGDVEGGVLVGGVDELDVVAEDHPGWFATVAGVVSLHGGSILAADAFARADGLAIDTFKIRPPAGAGGSWWARVEGDLSEAAAGRLAVRARVLRKARSAPDRRGRQPEISTTVVIEPDASGRATWVEVHTEDRMGVLYQIAAALAELHLDIVVARIQTLGPEVVDAFSVRDASGGPLDDDLAAEVELAVTAALEEL